MSRRNVTLGYKYDFKKSGSFGVFQSNGSIPIEYLMTSFSYDELLSLSYAKDVGTELNFDYLIQRDIDVERATKEISQYLAAQKGNVQKEIVFLPPILAAIVSVDRTDNLENYYPTCVASKPSDEFGEYILREWENIFQIRNYPANIGRKCTVEINGVEEDINVDINQAMLLANITPKTVAGARLVVIDGQHRLYALNALRKCEPNPLININIPVCIVFPPTSSENNASDGITPTIPEVLRSLFVDVNSKVERVSGHFLTLLSDQTLSSIICREMCKKIIDSLPNYGLGLIEWNIKNHKESMEIAREHTITSIGVINNALEEVFKTKNGVKIVSEIIDLKSHRNDFDFGEDEYGDKNPLPEYFPWRDFLSRHKESLTQLVNKTIVPDLYYIFFETSFQKKYINEYCSYLIKSKSKAQNDDRDGGDVIDEAIDYVVYNSPLLKPAKAKAMELIAELKEYIVTIPTFLRTVIFQKAIIDAWVNLISKMIAFGFEKSKAKYIIRCYIESAFDEKNSIFDPRNTLLQDTILNGNTIKVTKQSKNQIVRLLLSQGILSSTISNINKIDALNNEEEAFLKELARSELSTYIETMISDKRKSFERGYLTSNRLTPFEKDKLTNLESNKQKELASIEAKLLESETEFDKAVNEYISNDLESSISEIKEILNVKVFDYKPAIDDIDDEII